MDETSGISQGVTEPPMKLTIVNGSLLEAPCYETHHRGTNWLALIDVDSTSPGGLSRRFMNRGKGECLYDVEPVGIFDAVEFGADYTTSVGKRKRLRWFGVVVARTHEFMLVEQSESGARAVLRARKARGSKQDKIAALRAERDHQLDRLAELTATLEELQRIQVHEELTK